MPKVRKKPCRICRRWFQPDARVGERQRACRKPECHLYQPFHPAVLRLIRTVCEAAHQHGKWVGVCGEMAADPLAVALFLGLGVDELSMDPRFIPTIKFAIRQTRRSEAVALTEELLALNNAPQIVSRLEPWSQQL